ncbi:MAG: transglutaminase domain-containing protein [Lachnospiraceae bacterium]|nr:transglutaminase domain-containing protein [Lachnospiraceae bacterium]
MLFRRKKRNEIDTAYKPIVRDRRISVVGMVAYLGVVFSVLMFAQFMVVYQFNETFSFRANVLGLLFPIAFISALVILFWSFRFTRFPVVLVLVAVYLFWLSYQITANIEKPNDTRTLLDVLIRSFSEYYGFRWDGFGTGSDIALIGFWGFGEGPLGMLLILHLPFTMLLGYSMIRKFRFSSVCLALLFPCFVFLMNGYMPDRFYFLRLIFLFAVLSVLGTQMKIEEKQQLVKPKGELEKSIFCIRPPKSVNVLFGIIFATLIVAITFPPLLEEKVTEAVKPAQEFMYSGGPEKLLRAIRNKMFGTTSGGISGGDLASTGSMKPDKDHVLLRVQRTGDAYYKYSYIKCYVGEVYTGKRWADLPDVIRNQYKTLLPKDFSNRGYTRIGMTTSVLEQYAQYNIGDERLKNSLNFQRSSVFIENVDYNDGYKPLPYMANLPASFGATTRPYSQLQPAIGSVESFDLMNYNPVYLVRLYDAYCHEHGYMDAVTDTPQNLADRFYNEIYSSSVIRELWQDEGSTRYITAVSDQRNGRMIPELLFEYYGLDSQNSGAEAYEHILDEYLNVPDSVTKLREYMKDVRVDGVEDAIIYVRDALAELAEYSLSPGKIRGDADFVDTFLFEKHSGYCMHFATAGTLMFRLLGIPARYVEGFYLAPFNSGEQDVTEENAHAWTEIYLRNLGWIPIEVTPGFGTTDEWQKPNQNNNRPNSTQASTEAHTKDPSATTDENGTNATSVGAKDPSKPSASVVPGGPGSLTPKPGSSAAASEENENGTSIWPILLAILKVVAIVLGIALALYLLIMLRRSLMVSRRHRGFSQKDTVRSISALYQDMKKLATLEQHVFTYETDAAEIINWFDDLGQEEELFTQAIEAINLCFFGNRELSPDERKTVRMARNKLAAAVAKRQTGRKKWRYHLWYGY